jgi:hypothetical protein
MPAGEPGQFCGGIHHPPTLRWPMPEGGHRAVGPNRAEHGPYRFRVEQTVDGTRECSSMAAGRAAATGHIQPDDHPIML